MMSILGWGIGMPEAILIVIVVLLLFGGKRIPDLARSLGQSLNEFKKGRDAASKPEEEEKLKTSSADKPQDPSLPKAPDA
ncbi:MAG: twin-arginine translocase TatA/TatE family subunit [Kiritimatiellaeota bacterium]|nr:twin-arginine translocase TatA/TatE family subunit [Kiritimatiellota bacterium]